MSKGRCQDRIESSLRVFGTTRRSARAAYVRRLKGSSKEDWIGEAPGRLPWWRLGRPLKGEDEDPETAVQKRREREENGPEWRPHIRADQFITRGAELLGIEVDNLRSRRQDREVARARELLMALGVERYRLRVNDLAGELRKPPDGMTKTLARATRKKTGDDEFRKQLNELDRVMAKVEERD